MKILIMGLLVSLFFAPPVHSGMVIGSGAPTAIEVAVASASIAINSSSLPSEDIVSDVSSYNWGTVAQGSPSSHTFTFINQSMSNYSLLAPTYTGTNSADFATNVDTCTGTLLSHTSCTTSVNFTPGATGARSGAMNVSWMPAIAVNVASASIATAALTGEGGAPGIPNCGGAGSGIGSTSTANNETYGVAYREPCGLFSFSGTTCVANKIRMYGYEGTGVGKVKMQVLDASFAVLGYTTTEISMSTTADWNVGTLNTPVTFTNGQNYWLCSVSPQDGAHYYTNEASGTMHYQTITSQQYTDWDSGGLAGDPGSTIAWTPTIEAYHD